MLRHRDAMIKYNIRIAGAIIVGLIQQSLLLINGTVEPFATPESSLPFPVQIIHR